VERGVLGKFASVGALLLTALGLTACAPATQRVVRGPAAEGLSLPKAPVDAQSGRLRLLTYNVAGLPGIVSGSDPDENTEKVSPLLNRYDIVLAQEDFSYHDEFVAHAQHEYQVEPQSARFALVGDGLSTLSTYPLGDVVRAEWDHCHGYFGDYNDCLGEKGFSMVRVRLNATAIVHVYNVHADAGNSEGDVEARRQEFEQLGAFIHAHSGGHAVIVGGDTNLDTLRNAGDRLTLLAFLRKTGLSDSCAAVRCPDAEIDRVLLRGTRALQLRVSSWKKDEHFVDERGVALSDHPAIGVDIEWAAAESSEPLVVSTLP
jgi:hypothetical protein